MNVFTADSGDSAIRYQQTYRGVPVFAGEIAVQLDSTGRVQSTSGEASPAPDVDVAAEMSAAAAAGRRDRHHRQVRPRRSRPAVGRDAAVVDLRPVVDRRRRPPWNSSGVAHRRAHRTRRRRSPGADRRPLGHGRAAVQPARRAPSTGWSAATETIRHNQQSCTTANELRAEGDPASVGVDQQTARRQQRVRPQWSDVQLLRQDLVATASMGRDCNSDRRCSTARLRV